MRTDGVDMKFDISLGIANRDGGRFRFGVYNFGEHVRNGFEFGVANYTRRVEGAQGAVMFNGANYVNGFQIAPVNIVIEELYGLQIGLYCFANEGNYLQLGVLTYRESGPWYTRFSPFVGFRRSKKIQKERKK